MFPPNRRDAILNEIKNNPKFKGAMFRSYTGILYSNQLNLNQTKSVMCKEIFMMFPVVIYVPKNFYLTNAIDEQIQYLQGAGLIDYWHSEIIDQRYLKVQESSEPKPIKLEYLSGCFYIWIGSICLSSLAFIWEVMQWTCQKRSEKKKMKTKLAFHK